MLPKLGFGASTQALKTLQNAFNDNNPEVRYAILECLVAFHKILLIPNNLLSIGLVDEDPFVRELSIKASGYTRSE